MNPVMKIIAWLRRPATDAGPKNVAEAQRLHDAQEMIRGSQSLAGGQMGPSLASVPPTRDVLDPDDD
jgi:hypothetical protein